MKHLTYLTVLCLACLLAGCSEPASKTVTEGVDLDAIRAYEADLARVNKQQAEADPDAEEKAAAQPPQSAETNTAE